MAIEVITAPSPLFGCADNVRVFLAGSIDMGAAPNWQKNLIDAYKRHDEPIRDITFYNPRRPKGFKGKQTLDNVDFVTQVNWELDHINRSDIVLMYLTEESKAPISLLEFGYIYNHSDDIEFVLGVEQGFYRRGNLEVMADRGRLNIFDNLQDCKEALDIYYSNLKKKTHMTLDD
jgi:hypothetical protein